MKLRIKIDEPEDGEPLKNPFPENAAEKFEGVFEKELLLLCPQLENYPEIEVSVSFLDRAEMRDVNKQYRGADEPTDVLSFPMWEEGDFAPLGFAPGVLPMGDILICPEEAEKEHAPMERMEALCLVLAHGFLHLLGWDHDTQEKEADMWERQGLIKAALMKATLMEAELIKAKPAGEVL